MLRQTVRCPISRPIVATIAGLVLLVGLGQAAKEIKPGWNLFRPAQDVQLGKEASQEIEQQVEIVNDERLTKYVAGIGKRLADVAPGEKYPYSFKVVADPSINAFALPGGPMYVHTGLISAADNEAQLAGVLAHEVSHVALRHSTNQASKAYAFQIPIVLATGMLGNKGGLLGALSQIGVGFGLNSLFLKYSRNAEKDADILGARMLAEAGYDPIEMARFFEKLQGEGGAGGMLQFFSDHPSPGNRVRYVEQEVRELPSGAYTKGDTGEFRDMKARAGRQAFQESGEPKRWRRGGEERPVQSKLSNLSVAGLSAFASEELEGLRSRRWRGGHGCSRQRHRAGRKRHAGDGSGTHGGRLRCRETRSQGRDGPTDRRSESLQPGPQPAARPAP